MSDACDQIIVDVGYLPSGGHFLLALNSRYGNDGNHVQSGQCIMQTVTAAVYVQ